MAKLAAGNPFLKEPGIDPAKLPLRLVNGICTPVYPHDYLKVNTIYEVAHAARLRTAALSGQLDSPRQPHEPAEDWSGSHRGYEPAQTTVGQRNDRLAPPLRRGPRTPTLGP